MKHISGISILILATVLTQWNTAKKPFHKTKPVLSSLTNCIHNSRERNPGSHKPRIRLYAKNEDPTNDDSKTHHKNPTYTCQKKNEFSQ